MITLDNVRENEVKDLIAELHHAKRSLDEFDISVSPRRLLTHESRIISPIVGGITIRNKKTGVERTYQTGHTSTWIMSVIADIKAGEL